MTLHIDLTNPALEAMVHQKLADKLYSDASEVVSAALERMAQADARRTEKLKQLRADIQEGLNSGAGRVLDIDDIRQQAYAEFIASKQG